MPLTLPHPARPPRPARLRRALCAALCALAPLLSLSALTALEVTRAAAEPGAEERVAVLTLRNSTQLEKGEVDYLTGLVRSITAKLLPKRYLVMTQENIVTLLPPDTKIEDCVGECEVDTGRTLGARYIITGEVLRFGKSLRLTLRLHDTESGRLVGSEVAKGKEVEELETPTEEAVAALAAALTGEAPRPAPPAPVEPSPAPVVIQATPTPPAPRPKAQEPAPPSRRAAPPAKPSPKTPTPPLQSAAQGAQTAPLFPYRWGVALGLGVNSCAPNRDADCSIVENLESSSPFGDISLALHLVNIGRQLSIGLNLNITHAEFIGSLSYSDITLTFIDLSVGAHLRYQLISGVFVSTLLGVGQQVFDLDLVSAESQDDYSPTVKYQEPSFRLELAVGMNLGRFDLSLYYLHANTISEANVCASNDFGDESCETQWMPGIQQIGARLGVSFGQR